jgi:hypothetical protein
LVHEPKYDSIVSTMLVTRSQPLRLALRQQVQVLQLRRGEQLRGAVGARGDARTASDARGRVHRGVGDALRDQG